MTCEQVMYMSSTFWARSPLLETSQHLDDVCLKVLGAVFSLGLLHNPRAPVGPVVGEDAALPVELLLGSFWLCLNRIFESSG